MLSCLFLAFIATSIAAPSSAATTNASLRAALRRDLEGYLSARAKIEHLSAISLSVSLHGMPQNINVNVGTTTYGGNRPVTSTNLWQIGSNTKAFTAVTILQLEAAGKLTIDQTIGHWLPQYQAWKNVTIRQLLSMTSGIPTYDKDPAMLRDYAKDPMRVVSTEELITFVYPRGDAPPSKPRYLYSNTNYLLAGMIVERASGQSYAHQVRRLFSGLRLTNTYYAADFYPPAVRTRMVSGYYFNHDPDEAPLAPILGRDVRDDSVSWMQAAGGIVSTPEDLTRWARALYTGNILAARQQAELMTLVSMKTAKPIAKTSLGDPRGFGLGIGQTTARQTGTVWSYEGETFGYRMIHLYFPRQEAVIAFALNSAPDSKEDHASKLALSIYETLRGAGKL